MFNVFNIDQTNLQQSRPELYQKLQSANGTSQGEHLQEDGFNFPAIDYMIKKNKWICPIKPTYGDEAYYSISRQEIVIPEKRQFKSGESFYANLAHEMTHSTGAENQLNRLKPASFGSKEYAREELVAELSAALVSQRYGMEKVIKDDSVPYLKCWLTSLKESPDFIKTVLSDVKKASGMIIDHVENAKLDLENEREEEQQETKTQQNDTLTTSQRESAAKEAVSRFVLYSPGVKKYVSYVSNPTVRFKDQDEAMIFKSRDEARAIARECRQYMPDERFTVKELPAEKLGQSQKSVSLQDFGTYDIPEWSLNYLINGDPEGLSKEEIAEVDNFVKTNFTNAYEIRLDWNDVNEFNRYPAFGTRNADALVRHGESPFEATKTIKAQFIGVQSQPVVSASVSNRMSDLRVELRGELRQPWLCGKVDGNPVISELLSEKEFSGYMDKSISVRELAEKHFNSYLANTPEENRNSSITR